MLGSTTLWFIINCNTYFRLTPFFSDIRILQGSVATYVRCGGMFKHEFVANLLRSPSVETDWKSVNIWWSYWQKFGVLFFWLTVYTCRLTEKFWTSSVLDCRCRSQFSPPLWQCAANYNSRFNEFDEFCTSIQLTMLHIAHGSRHMVHSKNRWPTMAEEGNNWLGGVAFS